MVRNPIENRIFPCVTMHELSSDPATPHDSVIDLTLPRTPTLQHPTSRVSLRSSFRNLHAFATVIVGTGPSAQKFTLHKDLLTSQSPFFAAALNGAFAEGLDQTVRMPEEKPETFEWFAWYLYSGSLTSPIDANCSGNSLSTRSTRTSLGHQRASSPLTQITHNDGDLRNAAGSPKYFLLLDLYALSDRLLTTNLSNHILDTVARLSEATNSVPTPSDTWILYDTIPDTAPLRRLILDLFAYKKTDKLLENHRDEWHSRFLRELCVKLKRPGEESMHRHALAPWKPRKFEDAQGCEGCRDVVSPLEPGMRCSACERAFCLDCFKLNKVVGTVGDVGACKPWLRNMCARYHVHGKGVSCQ